MKSKTEIYHVTGTTYLGGFSYFTYPLVTFCFLLTACTEDDEQVEPVVVKWTKHVVGEQSEATYIYSEDVDGDGDLDVVTTSYTDGEILWYENLLR